MPPTHQLSRADEMLMVVVLVLGDDAFSTTIRKELARRARKKVTVGSLWVSLDLLVQRGYLKKRNTTSDEKRTGRPRVYYSVSARGLQALKRVVKLHGQIWKGVSDLDNYDI